MDLEMSPIFNFKLTGKELSMVIKALKERIKKCGLNGQSPESVLLTTIFEKRLKQALTYAKQLEDINHSPEEPMVPFVLEEKL